jgi:hypothetical protein
MRMLLLFNADLLLFQYLQMLVVLRERGERWSWSKGPTSATAELLQL